MVIIKNTITKTEKPKICTKTFNAITKLSKLSNVYKFCNLNCALVGMYAVFFGCNQDYLGVKLLKLIMLLVRFVFN